MADSATGKSKNLPNFYSAVGGMGGYSGKDDASAGAGKPPASKSADSGEKAKNVTALLEVVKKMDDMESDPENKKLLEQIAGLVEQYMNKLQPGSKAESGADGGAAAAAPGGAGAAGGAGATVGDKTGATAAM